MSSRTSSTPTRPELLAELEQAGRALSTAAVLYHAAVAEQMGLSPIEEKALGLLERHGALTAGELAERTGLANTTMTSLIDRLEKKGFVRRVRDEHDRRRVIVEVNVERAAHFAPLFEGLRQALGELYATYTDEQLATILDFLARAAERQLVESASLAQVTTP